jgi:streptogramin lyase
MGKAFARAAKKQKPCKVSRPRWSARLRPDLEILEDRCAPAVLGTSSLLEGPAAGVDSVVLGASGAWTATSNSPFLHLTAGSTSGTGNALVKYSFDTNSGATRSGTLTIAGLTLTVTQAASSYIAANPLTTIVGPLDVADPTGMCLDAAGNLYIADNYYENIQKWNPSTQQLNEVVPRLFFSDTDGVAVDNSGNVYFAQDSQSGGGALVEYSPATGQYTAIAPNGRDAEGVAVDAAGNVFYADSGWIFEWNPATQTQSTVVPFASGYNPQGVAVDAAGNVYFADYTNNAVYEHNAATGSVGLVVSGLNHPLSVAVDGSGNLYIADYGNNAIKEWNAATQQVTTLASVPSPKCVAVDAAGNVFLPTLDTSYQRDEIEELTRAFVPNILVNAGAPAGSVQLQVLPTSQSLTGVFTPTSSDPFWLNVGTGSNGVFNISYTILGTGLGTRTAQINVLGQQINVTQTAPPGPPALATSSVVEGPTAGADSMVLSDASAWTATSNSPFLHITTGSTSGTSNAVVKYSFDANTGATRTGTLTVAGLTLTVTQAGSTYVGANPVTSLVTGGGLTTPEGVAVDAAGNVYFSDTLNNAIEEWNATTQLVTNLVSTGLNFPQGVAVDAAGNVYIADTNNSAIKEWNATTHQVTTLISTGLNRPTGLAVDKSGNIYIADTNDMAVKKWTAATQQLTTLVSSGLDLPSSVAVDKSGNVYIANPPLNNVMEWNATTQQVTTLVSSGLNFPHGVAVDGSGNVYIGDSFNNVIKEWNAATQQVTNLVSGLNRAQSVAVDAAGNVYVADTKNFAIKEWKAATQQVSILVSPALNLPAGVTTDKAGNVYFADTNDNAIEEWQAATQRLSTIVTGLNAPHGVTVDAAGNVYFTDSGNGAVDEWTATTQQVTTVVSGLNNPYGVAVDAVGNIFFAEFGNNVIKEWQPITHQVTTPVSTGLNAPAGVAVDAAGNVYFADSGNNAIKEWNAATHQVTTLTSGLNGPTGVAVDAAGNVYIADTGNNAIKEWSVTTHQVTTLTSGLNGPAGVAVDLAGNVSFADTANNAIKTLTKALVPGTVNVGAAAGTASLQVLPSTESLTGLFASSSDQPWLTVGASANGVVNFSFVQNLGSARTAHLTVLGQPITIQQASGLPTITQFSVPGTGAEGSAVTLSATAALPAGVIATLTYTWTVTAPPGAGNNLTLTGSTVSFIPPDDGYYAVSLTVSDSGGSVSRLAPAGLQHWYQAEGNALDSQGGSAFHGTLVGGVTYAPGEVGQAFSFDGSTGYVQLRSNFLPYPTSGTGTTPLSFETWFQTSSGGVILGQQASPAFGAISGGWIPAVYVGTDGHLYAQMFWNGGAETPIASPGVVNDGKFHHVAVTYNGTTETLYLDGAVVGTETLSQVAYAASYNYQLGLGITYAWPAGNGGWFPFKGLIDEASFYNRALSATEVQSIVADGGTGKSFIAVPDAPPMPGLSGFTTVLATEAVTYTLSATHPSTTDVAGFSYGINWGDGSPNIGFVRTPNSVQIGHVFTSAGTYTVTLTAVDEDGGSTAITRTVTVLPVTSANLQTVISQQGSITTQDPDNTTAQTMVNAVNGLAAQTTPVTITMQLGSGSFTDTSGAPHAGITLVISGSGGSTTIVGHSPALQVSGGNVIVENLTLITDTNAPTLVISGGNVTLRNVDIEGNSAGSQPAIDITGGNVDLGTADDPGGNTVNAHGQGQLIHNAGSNGVDAEGDTFETDGTPLTSPYRIKDKILDALNAGGGGLVTYVPGNDYISVNGGDIQLGVNAIAPGGTVNVETGSYHAYDAGTKLVTIAFQNGPVLTQETDPLNPSLLTLVVTGAPGDNKILFNPGGGAGSSVKVLVNSLPQGAFSPNGRLIAYGGSGNNDIEVAGGITLPAFLYGGAGNDRLKGGGGNNVLVGGAGANTLTGGSKDDLMIGGSGPSTLQGGNGDDVMIAGTTAFDANDAALSAIMAEWTSARSYADRVANLSGTGNGPRSNGNYFLIAGGQNGTVFDNGVADVLNGVSGTDWIFANLAQDTSHGQQGSGTVENEAGATTRVTGSIAAVAAQPALAVASTGSSTIVFAIEAKGTPYEYTATSVWTPIGAPGSVAAISAVTQSNGKVVLFAEGPDHTLSVFIAGQGWQGTIGGRGTIASISAGLDHTGQADVFVIDTASNVDEWSTSSGWRGAGVSPAGAAVALSAVDNDRAYSVTTNGSVYGDDAIDGWFPLTASGFARSISATTDGQGNDTVYTVTENGALFEHVNATGWAQLGAAGTIQSISAGRDSANRATVFATTAQGQLAENDTLAGWSVLSSRAPAAQLQAGFADVLFTVLSGGSIYEHNDTFGLFPITGSGFAEV